jgi:hypothetical protein
MDKYTSQVGFLRNSVTMNQALKISLVFIAAIGNNFEHLPLKLIRKG